MSSVAVSHLCQSSLSFIKQMASKKQVRLEVIVPSHLGIIVVDDLRIRQALINLLSNAVKFTPSGGKICLNVKLVPICETNLSPTNDLSHAITFAIADTGIGIAPENMDSLFQAFVQIDSSFSRQYKGSGLGLTIVKQIAELHGGYVSVTSKVGEGSCFMIVLPYIQATER
jgi:signal transduction histidine kinase